MENQLIMKKDPMDMIAPWLRSLPRTFKTAFASIFNIGLCAHMFIYTNTLFNHDGSAVYTNITPQAYTSGHWMALWLQGLIGGLSLPWLMGLVTLTLMGISSWLVCDTLQIKRTEPVILVPGLMVTFPTVTSSHAYFSSALCSGCLR